MDLGLFDKTRPATLTGFDLNQTDPRLPRRPGARGVGRGAAPREGLSFERSEVGRLPAEDGAFDYAFSWSAFEHISRPIERAQRDPPDPLADGAFFLQPWPFYMSAKGSHLWDWFPEDFHHLYRPESEIAAEVLASDLKPEDWTEYDGARVPAPQPHHHRELQRAMLASGFVVRRLELLSSPTQLTPELARYSWLDLGVSGIKLIATPG